MEITEISDINVKFENGWIHCTDGPAVERADGTHEWWLNGVEYPLTEWLEHNQALDDTARLVYMSQHLDEIENEANWSPSISIA